MTQNNLIKLYDFVNKDGKTMSPRTWRTIGVLNYKNLEYEKIPLKFYEIKKTISGIIKDDSKPPLVPLIIDEIPIVDSFEIAKYIDNKYTYPKIFEKNNNHLFFNNYVENIIFPHVIKCIIKKEYLLMDEESQKYVFEHINQIDTENNDEDWKEINKYLDIIWKSMYSLWISGEKLGYSDIILWGLFKFIQVVSYNDFKQRILNNNIAITWFNKCENVLNNVSKILNNKT